MKKDCKDCKNCKLFKAKIFLLLVAVVLGITTFLMKQSRTEGVVTKIITSHKNIEKSSVSNNQKNICIKVHPSKKISIKAHPSKKIAIKSHSSKKICIRNFSKKN